MGKIRNTPYPIDQHKDRIRQMIEVDLLTQAKVAEALGVHLTTIERACARWGLKTQRTGPRALEGHPNWKGGRWQDKMGYIWIRADDHPNRTIYGGYVTEHRLVMEQKIGRLLERSEVVHHIDGDPSNNHPDNLMLFQRNSDHLRHELKGKCPNWSPEGRARIEEGVQKWRATRKKLRFDGDPQLL